MRATEATGSAEEMDGGESSFSVTTADSPDATSTQIEDDGVTMAAGPFHLQFAEALYLGQCADLCAVTLRVCAAARVNAYIPVSEREMGGGSERERERERERDAQFSVTPAQCVQTRTLCMPWTMNLLTGRPR